MILVSSIVILSIWRRKRGKSGSTQFRREIEVESKYFGFQVPVFSYAELKEATNNFDPSNELGDGGFGTVYYGMYSFKCKTYVKLKNSVSHCCYML